MIYPLIHSSLYLWVSLWLVWWLPNSLFLNDGSRRLFFFTLCCTVWIIYNTPAPFLYKKDMLSEKAYWRFYTCSGQPFELSEKSLLITNIYWVSIKFFQANTKKRETSEMLYCQYLPTFKIWSKYSQEIFSWPWCGLCDLSVVTVHYNYHRIIPLHKTLSGFQYNTSRHEIFIFWTMYHLFYL